MRDKYVKALCGFLGEEAIEVLEENPEKISEAVGLLKVIESKFGVPRHDQTPLPGLGISPPLIQGSLDICRT
ncbi:MAG: hypothetical protein CEN90_67 [Parcubacteria group bacterium Licking1014_17]|nr:MAG: hypothetical protein CEN90_67 [Parcubacteria group bacterium Licking1014_17]